MCLLLFGFFYKENNEFNSKLVMSEYAKRIARLHSSLSKATLKIESNNFRVVQSNSVTLNKIYVYIYVRKAHGATKTHTVSKKS